MQRLVKPQRSKNGNINNKMTDSIRITHLHPLHRLPLLMIPHCSQSTKEPAVITGLSWREEYCYMKPLRKRWCVLTQVFVISTMCFWIECTTIPLPLSPSRPCTPMMVLMAVMLNPFSLVEAKGLSLEEYGNNKPFGGKACGDASFCYFDEMF